MRNLVTLMVFLLFLSATAVRAEELAEPYRPATAAPLPLLPLHQGYGSPIEQAAEARRSPAAAAQGAAPAPEGRPVPVKAGADQAAAPPAEGWKWRGFNGWEYALIAGGAGGAFYLETVDPQTPRWSSRNDFDEGIRNALRLGGISERDALYTVADAMMAVMIAAPEIDSFIYQWHRNRDREAFYNTNMINLESFTFSSLATVLLQTQIARERPFVRNCKGGQCESGLINRSFPSGHAAYSFTGAGLLCTHHDYQHYYDDPDLESTVCASALAFASVDSVLRIMSDSHYATDVLAGTGIGLFSGFLLPRILHYWRPVQQVSSAKKTREPQKRFSVTPTLFSGLGAGLTCRYDF